MTKIIIYLTKFAITLLMALLVTSCQFEINGMNAIEGNKVVKTENRNVDEDFTAVEAKTGLEVEIIQGEKHEITVIADENLHEFIQTEIEDGVLIIKSDRSIKKAASKKIIVTMNNIEKLETSSGASMRSQNVLKGNNLDVETSSGSKMVLALEFDLINADSSSGSSMKLEGKSLEISLDSSSGSSINAGELKSNVVRAESSSGSSITAFPIVEFIADASSGSSITYINKPKSVTQNKSSGASISSK